MQIFPCLVILKYSYKVYSINTDLLTFSKWNASIASKRVMQSLLSKNNKIPVPSPVIISWKKVNYILNLLFG